MAKESSAHAPSDASSSRADVPRSRGAQLEIAKKLAAAVIVLIAAFFACRAGTRPSSIDFYQFWVVGRAVGRHEAHDVYTDAERQRLGELYWREALSAQASSVTPDIPTKRIQAAQQRQVLETFSTPWLYTLFGLVSSGDYDGDQARFQTFSTLAFVLAIAAFGHLLGYGPLGIALWVLFLTSWQFKPFSDEVIAGNVNRLQVALLALYAWLANRKHTQVAEVVSGAVLGMAILFKPNLAIVAVVLVLGRLIARQHTKLARECAGLAIGALAAVAISSVYFGSLHVWSDWIRTIPELLAQGTSAGGNYALSRLVLDRTGFSVSRMLPFELLILVVIALACARARLRKESATELEHARESKRAKASFDVLLVGLGAMISVLATDLVWLHYYVLCVPLALFALRPAHDVRRSLGGRVFMVAGAIAVASIALQLFIAIFDIPRPSAASPYVNFGALLLVAVSLIDVACMARVPMRTV